MAVEERPSVSRRQEQIERMIRHRFKPIASIELHGARLSWALFSPLGAALSLLSMGGLFLLAGYLAPMPPAER